MAYHGLTDRLPAKLFLTSPESVAWREKAHAKMAKDLGELFEGYMAERLPRLEKLLIGKINKTEIYRFDSKQWSSFSLVRGRTLRVSTIGRTFLDMLRRPELCGGMHHVIEVFEERAEPYLQPILGEIEQWGGPIDKVRAGYILEELIGLRHPTISSWEAFIARGGSRKLDPSEEYVPKWSEKWCLSLNV
jgi:predicted transcriptional regulator of viral defense system